MTTTSTPERRSAATDPLALVVDLFNEHLRTLGLSPGSAGHDQVVSALTGGWGQSVAEWIFDWIAYGNTAGGVAYRADVTSRTGAYHFVEARS